jgi:HK97 family phage portal protein
MWRWGAWGYRRLCELAMSNPHARRGLQLITQNIASVPLQVQRRDGNEWEASEEDAERVALFERPNDRTSRRRFFEKIVVALHCGGEFWLEKRGPSTGPNAGEVRSLRVILPDEFVGFNRNRQTGEVEGYRFSSRITGQMYERTTEEVLHVRMFNPVKPERGMAILTAGMALQQMQAAQEWNTNIAKGGGRVPGYWVPNAQAFESGSGQAPILSPEQIQSAQEDFDKRSRERAAANLDMFLTGAFERQKGDVTPKDADWIEGQKLAIRQIATLLGVSPTLLGDEKAGSLTDSGVNSEVRALMMLTVLPLLEWLLAEISSFVLPEGQRFYYDRDQIESLQKDVNALWRRYGDAFALGIIDRDEARVALGYEAEAESSRGSPDRQEDQGEEQDEVVGDGEAARSVPQLQLDGLLNGTGVQAPMDDVTEAIRARYESM